MKVINNKVNKIYDSDCLLHHWCWDRLDPKPKISTEQLDVDLLTLEGKRNVQEQVVVNVNYKPYVIWDATLQEAEHQELLAFFERCACCGYLQCRCRVRLAAA